MRSVAITVTASSLLLTACAAAPSALASATPSAAPVSASAVARDVPIPDTPAGRQLSWLMSAVPDAPIPEQQLTEHFSALMLSALPPAELNAVLVGTKDLRLIKILYAVDTAITAEVTTGGRTLWMELTVDAEGKISGLRMTPPVTPKPTPTTWKEIDERVRKAAPRVGFLAAEITRDGRCVPVRSLAPRTPRPLGSMFKLYVLAAVAKKIPNWDTKLTIKPSLKSLPSGELQDRPDNSKVSVLEAAKLMIGISDNTATDLLMHKVGRKTVEAYQSRNAPLLTTRELFALKGAAYPEHARRYLSLGEKQRRAYLDRVVAKIPLSEIKPWVSPRELDTIEWFGTPGEVCAAHARLRVLGDRRVGEVMSQSDAGLGLDAKKWRPAWFKGGSEAGVLALGHSATTKDGRTFFVTTMASDTKAPLDEGNVATEALALAKGAFELMAKG
ncbi:serine hydrolase [Nonomuraea dietziae]|uniref:serine hydrolase n=1 Tax=Nonomuraea dietziae TaxID=65515 RepID=UPI00341E8525